MSEHTRENEALSSLTDPVPIYGIILATVALVGFGVPIRRGVRDPILVTAGILTVVTLGAFFAYRHDFLSRNVAGVAGAGSSFAVVVFSGYALNQGVTATVEIPGLEWTIQLVLVGFLAAGGAIGIAIAIYAELSPTAVNQRAKATLSMVVLGFVAIFATALGYALVREPAVIVLGDLTQFQSVILNQLGWALGIGVVAVAYLVYSGVGWSFLDIRRPTRLELGWIVGGAIVLAAANVLLSLFLMRSGVEFAEHTSESVAQAAPETIGILIITAIVLTGPLEELLYRNLIQKSLYERFSRYGAIVVTSVIFAAVHYFAYDTAATGAILASLVVVFSLSIILGVIYERTANLVVPAVVHGVYNVFVYVSFYSLYA